MIAYCKHPLLQETAKEFRDDGYEVIDLRFKPGQIGKRDIIYPAPKKKTKKN